MKIALVGMIVVILTIFLILILFIRGIPELNTEYTEDFSYQKFSKIEQWMTREQVTQILGKPYEVWEPGYECWRYSRDTGKFDVLIFEGFVSIQVCFKDDKVIDTPRNIF